MVFMPSITYDVNIMLTEQNVTRLKLIKFVLLNVLNIFCSKHCSNKIFEKKKIP